MRNSYHGRTFGTVAITGNAAWKATSNDPFGTHYLHGTDQHAARSCRNCPTPSTSTPASPTCRACCTAAIHPHDVGALIAEPIQGVGGFTMAPDGLFKALQGSPGRARHPAHLRRGADRLGPHRRALLGHRRARRHPGLR